MPALVIDIIANGEKVKPGVADAERIIVDFDQKVGSAQGWNQQGGMVAEWGTKIGVAAAAGVAALGALAAVGAEKLAELGGDWDALSDKIRVGTGKTGEALADIGKMAEGQFQTLPVSMDDAGEAVMRLGKGLGLTGAPLGDLSTQVLNLARITGEELGGTITDVRGLVNNWGVDSEDMAGTLDSLFRATQLADVGFGDLASGLTANGVQLRDLGLGLDESTALLASLANAGVEASDVMPGFKKVIGEAAKSGKDSATAFHDFFAIIKGSPSDTAAAKYAVEQLGAKAGPQLASLIREGRLDYQGLLDQIRGGTDTINAAAADTDDWAEKLQVLKNNALVALKPAAEAVFGGINTAVDAVSPYLQRLMDAFSEGGLGGAVGELGTIWDEVWPMIQGGLSTLRDNALVWWDENKQAIGDGLLAGLKWGVERIADLRNLALEKLGEWLPAIGDWIMNVAVPYVEAHWGEWWDAFVAWIGPMISKGQEKLGEFMGKIGEWLVGTFIPWAQQKSMEWGLALLKWLGESAWNWLSEKLGELWGGISSWLGELPGRIGSAAVGMWDGIVSAFKGALNEVIGFWNQLHFDLPAIEIAGKTLMDARRIDLPDIPYLHEGGVYRAPTPGGEGLAMLLDGEVVSKPGTAPGAPGGVVVHRHEVILMDRQHRQVMDFVLEAAY